MPAEQAMLVSQITVHPEESTWMLLWLGREEDGGMLTYKRTFQIPIALSQAPWLFLPLLH